MSLEENAECIVFWALTIISSILCCFYVYFRFALRRVIYASQRQTYAMASAEAICKASVFNVRFNHLCCFNCIPQASSPRLPSVMRQISRLQYERTTQEWPIRIPSVNTDMTLPVWAHVESVDFADSAPLSCAQPVRAMSFALDASQRQQQMDGFEILYPSMTRAAAAHISTDSASSSHCTLEPTAADLGGEEADLSGEEQEGKACFVCLDADADAVLIECGHGGLCAGALSRPSKCTQVLRVSNRRSQPNLINELIASKSEAPLPRLHK